MKNGMKVRGLILLSAMAMATGSTAIAGEFGMAGSEPVVTLKGQAVACDISKPSGGNWVWTDVEVTYTMGSSVYTITRKGDYVATVPVSRCVLFKR